MLLSARSEDSGVPGGPRSILQSVGTRGACSPVATYMADSRGEATTGSFPVISNLRCFFGKRPRLKDAIYMMASEQKE